MVYLLAGVQLFGQFFYEVFLIGCSQCGRAHAVVNGRHLLVKTLKHIKNIQELYIKLEAFCLKGANPEAYTLALV